MYWILAAAVLVALAWYVGRLRRMHALRGRHHLVDLAAGLRQMQPQVKRGYGQFTSHSAADSERAPPSHTTASGGALVAWTAAPAPEGGALHKITLMSYYETWWINGFLMLFICERLGLPVVPARPRNRTASSRTADLLASTELQELVAGLYRKDFQVFGYDAAP